MRAYIRREGFLIAGNGIRASLDGVFKVFQPGSRAYRIYTPVENFFGKHAPCTEFTKDLNSMKERVKEEIIADLDSLVISDVLDDLVKEASVALQATVTKHP